MAEQLQAQHDQNKARLLSISQNVNSQLEPSKPNTLTNPTLNPLLQRKKLSKPRSSNKSKSSKSNLPHRDVVVGEVQQIKSNELKVVSSGIGYTNGGVADGTGIEEAGVLDLADQLLEQLDGPGGRGGGGGGGGTGVGSSALPTQPIPVSTREDASSSATTTSAAARPSSLSSSSLQVPVPPSSSSKPGSSSSAGSSSNSLSAKSAHSATSHSSSTSTSATPPGSHSVRERLHDMKSDFLDKLQIHHGAHDYHSPPSDSSSRSNGGGVGTSSFNSSNEVMGVPSTSTPPITQTKFGNFLGVSALPPSLDEKQRKVSRAQARKLKKSSNFDAIRANAEREVQQENDQSIEEERQAIEIGCQKLGVRVKEIDPDGHCLYSAIADQVNVLRLSTLEKKETYSSMRSHAAQYLRDHPDDFLPFLESETESDGLMSIEEYNRYCDSVQNTGEWGGEPEIKALSRYFESPIHVLQAGKMDLVKFGDDMVNPHRHPQQNNNSDNKVQHTNTGSGRPIENNGLIKVGNPEVLEGSHSNDRGPILISYHRKMYGLGEHYNSLRPLSHTGSR